MKLHLRLALTLLLFSWSPSLSVSQSSSFREYTRSFLTYPFSDPNPVARTGKIYPYFRFDGFATKGINCDWKIVELENEWIRVMIAPEMGGKILGAIEKSTGQEFIYWNKVIKFRDIAMRGAWTSGGIEFNFGSIGHAPTTASPVDYLVRMNSDGSASCWIGAMDLTSRTEWRVEIRLPKDKAWIETNIFWYNPMDLSTSKYHWATAAADAAPDLTYIYPGDHYIGHGGEESPWPVLADGRNISNYAENNYGADHSYHVLGTYTDYFAGFYSSRNFGFGHWNDYPEKPGKKIWIWALSPQGALWTDLLTDQPGNMQYTEIQTGILFNQEAASSTYTPFKHMGFPSNTCERFSEYWFPVVGTGGVTEISKAGILYIDQETNRPRDGETGGKTVVHFSPLEYVKDTMFIGYTDGTSAMVPLDLKPLELFSFGGHLTANPNPGSQAEIVSVRIGTVLNYSPADQAARDLDRPVVSSQFDWNSVQGLWMQAIEFSRQREYSQSRVFYRKCLAKDGRYIPALKGLAEEYIRIDKPKLAEELLQTALGLDTYDPGANYLFGLVKKGSRSFYQAKEAFGIAARSMEYRSAAYCQMAEISLTENKPDRVLKYSGLAQDYNRYNIRAMQYEVIAHRISGNRDLSLAALEKINAIDPLNHFAGFEKYLDSGSEKDFTSLIRNEFLEQTYLELAIFYHSIGLNTEAIKLLELAPACPEVDYWRHYLTKTTSTISTTSTTSTTSTSSSTKFSFPWRLETLRVIEQAESEHPDWRNRYYLGLIRWNLDDSVKARELFRSCKDEPAEAHFYLSRAKLFDGNDDELVVNDLDRAVKLDPGEWRTWQALTGHYMKNRAWAQALEVSRKGTEQVPGHMIMEFDRAKAELYNHHYDQCLDILNNLIILPAEGAREGHEIYRSALILRALDHFRQQQYARVLKDLDDARQWPETLGVGRPYVTDERIENYLAGLCYLQMNRPDESARCLNEVISWTEKQNPAWGSPHLLAALSQVLLNRETEGDKILNNWMKVQPASPLMMWTVAAYSNNPAAAGKALERLGWKPEETPWVLGDGQLALVYEVVKKVMIK
ncbi:MAG: DUF5107 domain-containing protein [Bacteroidota bacterium]